MTISFLLVGFGLPKTVEKKVRKELQRTFQIENFDLSPIQVSDELNEELPMKIKGNNFFRISSSDKHLGFMFVDKARSKTAEFDYLVVFDNELAIVHSKVLIYREEYGGEIGSKRWLKQFMGKTGSDRVDHEKNIDGIAGATISVRSMTSSIDDLLQTIGLLQNNQIL
ncbi:FMN-binding protein [Maribacter sp. HTCC2170]|nr:FMN-binding protein [Maribacter sp. HTCC2170]